jgi:hypothetical protein
VISAEGFTESFPAFADTGAFPVARIEFWLNMARKMLKKERWGEIYEEGAYLYTAHFLLAETQAMGAGEGSGGGSGGGGGIVTSESQSVGDASFSQTYDTSSYAGAGQMAATSYGQMFVDLSRMIGAGGVQLRSRGSGSL